MALAANELKKPSMSTGAVADAVGYQSEAAFQRAFKRHMGITPAQWRKTQQASSADLFPMRRSSKAKGKSVKTDPVLPENHILT
jgi:AraC family transcriptional regulator, activator of mtrCDE